jgi:hypothetical protein
MRAAGEYIAMALGGLGLALAIVSSGCAALQKIPPVITSEAPCIPLIYAAGQCVYKQWTDSGNPPVTTKP